MERLDELLRRFAEAEKKLLQTKFLAPTTGKGKIAVRLPNGAIYSSDQCMAFGLGHLSADRHRHPSTRSRSPRVGEIGILGGIASVKGYCCPRIARQYLALRCFQPFRCPPTQFPYRTLSGSPFPVRSYAFGCCHRPNRWEQLVV